MLTSTDWIHKSVPSYFHFCWFIDSESRFLMNFTIMTYRVKFNNYSLRTQYHTYGNTKGVNNYSGTGIFLFIGKMS